MPSLDLLWRIVEDLKLDLRVVRNGLVRIASTSPSSSPAGPDVPVATVCQCGSCLSAGAISACGAIGDAPTEFQLLLTGELADAFGDIVVLTHDSSCTWVSDLFEDVDLGDGNHDYTWTLVFTGTGIEEATLTLSDET